MSFKVYENAICVSFHGWPRIETKAELDFYEKMGWDIVGQTIDPEATFARLYGLCYGAVAVQIDEPSERDSYAQGNIAKNSTNKHTNLIKNLRKKTTSLILETIKNTTKFKCETCNKLKRSNNSFKQFPDEFYKNSSYIRH